MIKNPPQDDNHFQEVSEAPFPISKQAKTKVTTDIDYEADGVQISHLKVPFSRNDSAWGRMLIPIAKFKNGEGPKILLTGGIHGDEYEGPTVLSKIIQRLKLDNVKGTIIILPAVNLPAHYAGTRISPLDHLDLNRSFPGNKDGTLTSVIAHYMTEILVPMVDMVIDIHSGGTSLDFVPSVVIHELSDKKQMDDTLEMLNVFGAPFGLILKEMDGDSMFDTAVESQGKIFLSTELRGGGSVTPYAVQVGDNGVCNVLNKLGVAKIGKSKYTKYNCKQTPTLLTIPHEDCFVDAHENGLYEPVVELGQDVKEGETIGQIHFLPNLRRKPKLVKSPYEGVVIAKRFPGRVEMGDCIAVIGMKWKRS